MGRARRPRPTPSVFRAIVGIALWVAASGCTTSNVDALYAEATFGASHSEVREVGPELFPISDDNPEIEWRTSARREVLVVSAMSREIFEAFYGEFGTRGHAPDGHPRIWVSAFPQLKQACQDWNLAPSGLRLRLNQYLGLPPATPSEILVELWVDRTRVFRPCADPEVNDSSCRSGKPAEDTHVDGVEDYTAFLTRQAESSNGEEGYPWTRLGYTYDWNPDSSGVGVSEYVLTPGAQWSVHRVVPLEEYCSRADALEGN